MTTKKLHFKVCGEGFTDLIRGIYLYEDKDKAWNMISTMKGLTVEQAKAVFMGDAEFFSPKEDDGTVGYRVKENKGWKEEFARHVDFLIQREKEREQEEKIIYSDDDDDDDDDDDEVVNEILGSDDILEKLQKQANLDIAKQLFLNKYSGKKTKEELAVNDVLIKTFANKQYSFVFKGHQYTFDDSARNQSECPHCEHKSPDGFMWRAGDEGYLGYHKFDEKNVALCFECPECFENFYFHHDKDIVMLQLENNFHKELQGNLK